MKTKSIIIFIIFVLPLIHSTGGSSESLECELLKQDILEMHKNKHEDPCKREEELCMRSVDTSNCSQRHFGCLTGKALRSLFGSSPEDQQEAKIKEYKEKCE